MWSQTVISQTDSEFEQNVFWACYICPPIDYPTIDHYSRQVMVRNCVEIAIRELAIRNKKIVNLTVQSRSIKLTGLGFTESPQPDS